MVFGLTIRKLFLTVLELFLVEFLRGKKEIKLLFDNSDFIVVQSLLE